MIEAIAPLAAIDPAASPLMPLGGASPAASGISFQEMLMQGVEATNTKIADADKLVAQFAVDSSLPAHQVTFALEEARLSLEMMIQVRNRLVEGYQQIMNMQV